MESCDAWDKTETKRRESQQNKGVIERKASEREKRKKKQKKRDRQ
jgi:hypothetical protein